MMPGFARWAFVERLKIKLEGVWRREGGDEMEREDKSGKMKWLRCGWQGKSSQKGRKKKKGEEVTEIEEGDKGEGRGDQTGGKEGGGRVRQGEAGRQADKQTNR